MSQMYIYTHVCVLCSAKLLQSCLTLCDTMDHSPPGSSVHGIFQARILEWIAISSSRGSSRPRNRTQSLALQADSLSSEPPRKLDLKKPQAKLNPYNASGSELQNPSRLSFLLHVLSPLSFSKYLQCFPALWWHILLF